MTYLRFRQLCLVASQLEPVVEDLADVFGIQVCHRDPAVQAFGLHNALLPVGNTFIEVVAPTREDTTAGRFLRRRGGDGGYMVILDTDDVDRWGPHVDAQGVRVAAFLGHGDYRGMQLHPKDLGGTLLEINHTRYGESLDGPYNPAGPDWQSFVNTERVQRIVGVELQGAEPEDMARRWGSLLRRPVENSGESSGGGQQVVLDNAYLHFVADRDGRGEGLSGVDILVNDLEAIKARALERGLPVDQSQVSIGGVRFHLVHSEGLN
ncbi:hypothetical protein A6D6_04210 [Alcanivorax xiamenensis]|uniref:VOC domain-containing protein n=1 Tax=Alcanivorax xiamenensis TaxID=1177156 RepID=A0ABQ6Y265_9GAMM|nr:MULTISPECIES: VOC family protein [Alcanivorax]KAF0801907.1 hypothetical protein A6D6_04210 [Alcanivorax xiamenensis]